MSLNLDNFVLVYSHTSHPGNLGSIARAAKNMGIKNIRLVNPQADKADPAAQANAAGATDTLAQMTIYPDMASALADCQLVFATSARHRALNPLIVAPSQVVQIAKQDLTSQEQQQAKIAILFGTESSGLSNDELLLGHYHVVIDANPDYTSLNLAMATLLLCYEIRQQVNNLNRQEHDLVLSSVNSDNHQNDQAQKSFIDPNNDLNANLEKAELASMEDYHKYFQRLEDYYTQIGFIQHSMVIPRLKLLYMRAKLTKKEIDLLQGMLSASIKNTAK
ncbi:RNA methyltransferase [Psittacicella hinzii]|uniref:tRNA (cytidine/uridine-2'-O-)-methyltransferase TrmJ n=1 Tax=Psittacicella hinzii TaxID=2028575 RepID=A0A3A1YBC6_9GAMM|nr:TrmJ/YjtD family RNA methyltransferase [Psittacicella hinzii]RIY35593.1 hypothetical protein CKF58_06625 [Psittacicella hinzii]